jgi:hypothetical protein
VERNPPKWITTENEKAALENRSQNPPTNDHQINYVEK